MCNCSYLLHFISVDSPFGLPIFDHRRLLPWHLISAPYEPQSTNIRYGDANKKKINWSRGVSFQEQFINVRLQWHPVVFKLNVLRAYVHWFAHWPRVSRQGAHRCWHFGCLTQTRIASHNKLRTYDGAFPENWSPSHTHIVRSADWIKKKLRPMLLVLALVGWRTMAFARAPMLKTRIFSFSSFIHICITLYVRPATLQTLRRSLSASSSSSSTKNII